MSGCIVELHDVVLVLSNTVVVAMHIAINRAQWFAQ